MWLLGWELLEATTAMQAVLGKQAFVHTHILR